MSTGRSTEGEQFAGLARHPTGDGPQVAGGPVGSVARRRPVTSTASSARPLSSRQWTRRRLTELRIDDGTWSSGAASSSSRARVEVAGHLGADGGDRLAAPHRSTGWSREPGMASARPASSTETGDVAADVRADRGDDERDDLTVGVAPLGGSRPRRRRASTSAEPSVKSSAWRNAAPRRRVSGASGRPRWSASTHGRTMSIGRAATVRRTTSVATAASASTSSCVIAKAPARARSPSTTSSLEHARPQLGDLVGGEDAQRAPRSTGRGRGTDRPRYVRRAGP